MKHRSKIAILLFFILGSSFLSSHLSLLHAAPPVFNAQLGPAEDSKAYQKFCLRPFNELSKIVYLIDRLKESRVQVVYDDIFFNPIFVAKVAKWFLSQRYQGQKAQEFVLLYCNASLIEKKLIWVKDEKEVFKLSREILLEELKKLEEIYTKDPKFQGKI